MCSVPSLLSLLSMLPLMCQSVVSYPPIQPIRGVTLEECGIGRESQLFDDHVFSMASNGLREERHPKRSERHYRRNAVHCFASPTVSKTW